jgi:NAD(P)-dependent dehydrogenase (short-subunit alcohol dehydrogenase family)
LRVPNNGTIHGFCASSQASATWAGVARAIDPMRGGYCASKLAVEAAADTRGYELAASNIEVAVVQPAGAYPTKLQANAYEDEQDGAEA